jgi:ATP-binding cassette, subfamily B (MDR/TAP), member 1
MPSENVNVGQEEFLSSHADDVTEQKATWKSLFNFSSRRHASILILALFFSIAAGITGPALAIFFGRIFDAFAYYGSGVVDGNLLMHKVSTDAIALCILGGTICLLKGGYFALWMCFGELQAKNVRDQLFQDLLLKHLEWYDLRESGIGTLLPRLQTYARTGILGDHN